MEVEKTQMDVFTEESRQALKAGQDLGYLSTEELRGDLFDVLNVVAEGAFAADEDEQVLTLRERLFRIRDLREELKPRLPFFGIGVSHAEDGSINLIFGD